MSLSSILPSEADVKKARLYFSDGRVKKYDTDQLAYAVYLALPAQYRVAFRGTGDKRPVYPHDYVSR